MNLGPVIHLCVPWEPCKAEKRLIRSSAPPFFLPVGDVEIAHWESRSHCLEVLRRQQGYAGFLPAHPESQGLVWLHCPHLWEVSQGPCGYTGPLFHSAWVCLNYPIGSLKLWKELAFKLPYYRKSECLRWRVFSNLCNYLYHQFWEKRIRQWFA